MSFQTVRYYLDLFKSIKSSIRYNYEWHHHHNGGLHEFHIAICSIIHGDEVGSLPAILQIIENLQSGRLQYGGLLTIILGNPEAAMQNVRFIESDLNRVFIETKPYNHETERAQEIMPILNDCDLLLDLHQTILPSYNPFYIFPHSDQSFAWAKAIKATTALVDATPRKPATTRCADEYVWLQQKPAITLELGKKGFSQLAQECSLQTIRKTIELADDIHLRNTTLDDYKTDSLKIFQTVHREPFSNPNYQLRPGLINFTPVKKGELLTAQSSPKIHASADGKILFPKYPPPNKALPKEIFRIIA